MIKNKVHYTHFLSSIILLTFLAIGIIVYDDYGLAWDEETQYYNNGLATIEFIVEGDAEKYLANPEKYHGPAFEVLLVVIQQFAGVTRLDEIFKLRHLVSYLFFWISSIFLGLLLRKMYGISIIVPIGLLWYFLMPRIFADSFYNSKDIPMLAMTVICLWSMKKFTTDLNTSSGILHGVLCGFLIAIRITGIIVPLLTILYLFMLVVLNNSLSKKLITSTGVYILSVCLFTVVFWPVLWIDPVTHFINAWNEMSKFSWHNKLRYLNAYIMSDEVPWHYNFVWISITTPVLYIGTFIYGLIIISKNLLTLQHRFISNHLLEFICMVFITIPLASIIILNSVVYDAWRHIFFIYAPFLVIALFGLNELLKFIQNRKLKNPALVAVFLFTSLIGIKMYSMHPYQNVYFNILSRVDNQDNRFRFEMDYWGLSYREALEKLLAINPGPIKLNVDNSPGYTNTFMLPEHDRNRIEFYSKDSAEYFISNYRWADKEFDDYNKIDSIMVDGVTINSTFKLR